MRKNKLLIAASAIVGTIIIGAAIYFTPFILGKWSNKVDKVVGTEHANVQREKWKNNKSHVEGMISDLSKYKREYDNAPEDEKPGVAIFIQDTFANFDAELIESDTLYTFLIDIREGNLSGGKN